MKKVLLIGLVLVFSASFAIAANVSGIVTDLDTGEAIENATVIFCFTDSLVVRGGGNGVIMVAEMVVLTVAEMVVLTVVVL